MNNPNFPVSQGERRLDEAQLSRITKAAAAHMPSSNQLPVPQHQYQVTKSLTRHIAPAPGTQVLGTGIGKPGGPSQIGTINPAIHKKEIQKTALSLTSSAPVTSLPTGSSVIPVQIGGPPAAVATSSPVSHASSLHVPNVSSIVRGAMPGASPHVTGLHLPRGVVAASAQVRATGGASTVSLQQQQQQQRVGSHAALSTSLQHLPAAHSAALSLAQQQQSGGAPSSVSAVAAAAQQQQQIRGLPQQMLMRPGAGTSPGTLASNRPGSPAVVSLGAGPQVADPHRSGISQHMVTSAINVNTPSIQITLQAPPRPGHADPTVKSGLAPVPGYPTAGKVHLNAASGLTTTPQQPKVVMSHAHHAITPVLPHPTLAAKGNRGQPMSTVTVALSTTTVTIPIISTGTTSSSLPIGSTPPIAKVLPQRQLQHQSQPPPPQGHTIPVPGAGAVTTPAAISSLDHRTTEPTSTTYPAPLPAHSHVTANTAGPPQPAHSQSSASLFIPQPHRVVGSAAGAVVTTASTVASNSVGHSEQRESTMPAMPFLPCFMPAENPFYHTLMRSYVENAQAHALARPGLISTQNSASLAASLQQAVSAHSGSSQPSSTGGASVRFHNPMMVVPPESLRQAASTSQSVSSLQTSQAAQLHSTNAEAVKLTTSSVNTAPSTISGQQQQQQQQQQQHVTAHSVGPPPAVGVASSLYTAQVPPPTHLPQIGQPAPNTPSSAPNNNSNPSASPRPSILRKRTNEGVSAVKKQLSMSSVEVHSPRPEPRPDSTPQSNMSSPKTPASGESQSSTDTALSSEATTPTQSHGDKVKTEPPEPHENGFPNNTPEASPRKRRKQLLQATEEIRDTPVNVFDKLVEACIKEDDDDFDDDGSLSEEEEKYEIKEEYVDDDGIRWTLEKCRPNVSLLNFYNISWKPRNNHFVRYTDVKAKDERRPSVNELSNQKGVLQKASGWKLYHMAAQIEDLVELEGELNTKLSSLQATLAPTPPAKHSLMEDEGGMLHELTQGNIQRCKLITDQLGEAKSTMLKVLEHKPKISEIITKHMSKRPIKKKERT